MEMELYPRGNCERGCECNALVLLLAAKLWTVACRRQVKDETIKRVGLDWDVPVRGWIGVISDRTQLV